MVDRVDLVSPKLDAIRLIGIARMDLDDIPANAEHTAVEIDIDPLVLELDKLPQESRRVLSSFPGSK